MRRIACLGSLVLFLSALLVTLPTFGQTAKLVTESYSVPTPDPGIQLYVRNKRPDGVGRFGAERTVLFVHGATYPAESSFARARWIVVDGLYGPARLRRLPDGRPRIRGIDTASRNESASDGEPTDRTYRRRCERRGHGGGSHPGSARPAQDQSLGVVMGHGADGSLHGAEQRQGRASCPLRARLAPDYAGRDRPGRSAGCLSDCNKGGGRSDAGQVWHPRSNTNWYRPSGSTPGGEPASPLTQLAPHRHRPSCVRRTGVVEDGRKFWSAGTPYYAVQDHCARAPDRRGMGRRDSALHGTGTLWKAHQRPGQASRCDRRRDARSDAPKNRTQLLREVQLFLEEPR